MTLLLLVLVPLRRLAAATHSASVASNASSAVLVALRAFQAMLLQLAMRLCLKTHSSLVSGFTPLRADIAGFLNFNAKIPA